MTMKKWMPVAFALLLPAAALAQNPFEQLGSAAASAGKGQLEKSLNEKLLAEAQKNQCSFKSGTDVLAPGCDTKLRRLANVLIDAKKQLASANVGSYKFEVSGHTDSTGDAAKNKALSEKRAQ
ncbi:MAG: OmpA family protein, partial [Myxococcaceae bacterium]|nr:OmpA family protein [Myxococcaceae bacterium]